MKPKFRILENKKGKYEVYYVSRKTFWGKEILKPFVTYSGIDKAYGFTSLEMAIKELKIECVKQCDRAEYTYNNKI